MLQPYSVKIKESIDEHKEMLVMDSDVRRRRVHASGGYISSPDQGGDISFDTNVITLYVCSIVFDYPYLTLIPAYTYVQNEHPKPLPKPIPTPNPLQVQAANKILMVISEEEKLSDALKSKSLSHAATAGECHAYDVYMLHLACRDRLFL